MTLYKPGKGSHSIYFLNYHLVIIVKDHKSVLCSEIIRERLKQIIYDMAEKWEREKNTEMSIEIVAQEPGEDNHHVLFRATPSTSLTKVVNSIKGASARVLKNEFPEIKSLLSGDALWAPSYFLATTGQVSLNVLTDYINQEVEKSGN